MELAFTKAWSFGDQTIEMYSLIYIEVRRRKFEEIMKMLEGQGRRMYNNASGQ